MRISLGTAITNFNYPLSVDPIAALFKNGEEGAWYDPSDLTTLYQDAAGITLAGVGDPVGLMLDKSKGLVLGSELVANGGFDVDASWTKGTGWTISSGEASHAAGTASYLSQSVSLTLGKTYRATCDVVSVSGGSGAFQFRSGGTTTGMTVTSANVGNTIEIFYRAEGNTQIAVFAGAGTSIVVDNISVRELPGNHATQATSTARPTLQLSGSSYYLDFDGADDFLLSSLFPGMNVPITAACAFNAPLGSFVFDANTDNGFSAYLTFNNPVELVRMSVANHSGLYAACSHGQDHVVRFLGNGVSSAVSVDGVETTGTSSSSANVTRWTLGKPGVSGSYRLDGSIYGFLAVNRTLDPDEITSVESYLADKTGFTAPVITGVPTISVS